MTGHWPSPGAPRTPSASRSATAKPAPTAGNGSSPRCPTDARSPDSPTARPTRSRSASTCTPSGGRGRLHRHPERRIEPERRIGDERPERRCSNNLRAREQPPASAQCDRIVGCAHRRVVAPECAPFPVPLPDPRVLAVELGQASTDHLANRDRSQQRSRHHGAGASLRQRVLACLGHGRPQLICGGGAGSAVNRPPRWHLSTWIRHRRTGSSRRFSQALPPGLERSRRDGCHVGPTINGGPVSRALGKISTWSRLRWRRRNRRFGFDVSSMLSWATNSAANTGSSMVESERTTSCRARRRKPRLSGHPPREPDQLRVRSVVETFPAAETDSSTMPENTAK